MPDEPTFFENVGERPLDARLRPRTLDEVLGRPVTSAPGKRGAWQVEEQVSSVSLQGSFGNLVSFLSALDRENRALRIAGFHLRSRNNDRGELVLDLQIKTLNLVRGSSG